MKGLWLRKPGDALLRSGISGTFPSSTETRLLCRGLPSDLICRLRRGGADCGFRGIEPASSRSFLCLDGQAPYSFSSQPFPVFRAASDVVFEGLIPAASLSFHLFSFHDRLEGARVAPEGDDPGHWAGVVSG